MDMVPIVWEEDHWSNDVIRFLMNMLVLMFIFIENSEGDFHLLTALNTICPS